LEEEMKVGFIGLGDQGAPMAENVLAAGHELLVYARRSEVREHFAGLGATVVDAPAELGTSELLEICVVDDAQVEGVLVGDGVLDALAPGSIVAIHSTIHPTTCRTLGDRAAESGVEIVDAPVSGGGAKAARERKTVTLVGGTVEAFEYCRPVFEAFGSAIYLGPLGSGQLTKLLNNVFFTVQMAASHELARLATELGIDRVGLSRALPGCTSASWVLSRYAASGFTHLAPQLAGGREHVIRLFEKDVGTFNRVAAELGVDAELVQGLAGHGLDLLRCGGELVWDPEVSREEYNRRIGVLDNDY